jgi:mRNA-degrading endonuclease RelE of RelBE toxin-antitoxin system
MPPLGIEFSPRFRSQARALPAQPRKRVANAVAALSDVLGKPHVHSGLGIRRLSGSYFEFRANRETRIVFKLERSTLTLLMVGNHDEVRRFLRNL